MTKKHSHTLIASISLVFLIFMAVWFVFHKTTGHLYDPTNPIWNFENIMKYSLWTTIGVSLLHAIVFNTFFFGVHKSCDCCCWIKTVKVIILYWIVASGIWLIMLWMSVNIPCQVLTAWGVESLIAIFLSGLALNFMAHDCDNHQHCKKPHFLPPNRN